MILKDVTNECLLSISWHQLNLSDTGTISRMDLGWWDEKNNCLWTLCLLNEPHWQMISWRNNFLLLILQTIKIPQKKVRHISYVFMCLKHISSSISHVSSSCGCSDNCLLTQWDKLCKAPPPHMPHSVMPCGTPALLGSHWIPLVITHKTYRFRSPKSANKIF